MTHGRSLGARGPLGSGGGVRRGAHRAKTSRSLYRLVTLVRVWLCTTPHPDRERTRSGGDRVAPELDEPDEVGQVQHASYGGTGTAQDDCSRRRARRLAAASTFRAVSSTEVTDPAEVDHDPAVGAYEPCTRRCS